jgi:hypothetical protein
VLIDPHPLAEDALARPGAVATIVLTASVRQRASWRLRREFGIPVWMPAATREAEEEPDERYSEGDRLPGGLEVIFTPGAGRRMASVEREDESLSTSSVSSHQRSRPPRYLLARRASEGRRVQPARVTSSSRTSARLRRGGRAPSGLSAGLHDVRVPRLCLKVGRACESPTLFSHVRGSSSSCGLVWTCLGRKMKVRARLRVTRGHDRRLLKSR